MDTATLQDLSVGQSATVLAISNDNPAYRRQLLAMGLIPGTSLTLVRVAPLGDPMELEVRGFKLSLRRAEAKAVTVEVSS
ncbi:FeoA family protein [Zooshikella ganghwensis]|uniref:Ferrous iron transport protein A n=1 Tax=Zooshikella ganghwensis TaxID=202772 RepID=A0A4P9VJJ4_9GAMM|nr:FeoA family protein [Zooshikella ganghwensis]RDH42786.1 ferrous iron transport protein A [Zooshikella ganghwensis]